MSGSVKCPLVMHRCFLYQLYISSNLYSSVHLRHGDRFTASVRVQGSNVASNVFSPLIDDHTKIEHLHTYIVPGTKSAVDSDICCLCKSSFPLPVYFALAFLAGFLSFETATLLSLLQLRGNLSFSAGGEIIIVTFSVLFNTLHDSYVPLLSKIHTPIVYKAVHISANKMRTVNSW